MSNAGPHRPIDPQSFTLSPAQSPASSPVVEDVSDCEPAQADPPNRRGPWIRYRTEFRDRTGDILHRVDSDTKQDYKDASLGDDPILELITRYDTGLNRSDSKPSSWNGLSAASAPSYSLRIFSLAIINALQNVVEYYPSQKLFSKDIEISWPWAVLVHHYDELQEFKIKCQSKNGQELCARERDAPEHIDYLIQFLDDNIMERVMAEKKRLAKGAYTFDDLWVSHKPGRTIGSLDQDSIWKAFVISDISGGSFVNPPTGWSVRGWTLDFDGTYVGRCEYVVEVAQFDGERNIGDSRCFIDDVENISEDKLKDNVAYGEMWFNLLQKQCMKHMGKSLEFPYNRIEGLVMADLETYYEETGHRPDLMEDTDCSRWSSSCACDVCQKRVLDSLRKVKSPFDDYNDILPSDWTEGLTTHMYLLCPFSLCGYVFKLRTWQLLHVKNYQTPFFHDSMIDDLVMNKERIRILKALASSYIRVNHRGNRIEHDAWAADFVEGKGSGLICLLHGKPGVGKTVTAESIAEYTKRPLMILTSADVGTNPILVEGNLTRQFKIARRWGAVLLIDEADVFMERRGTADLVRNSLVAAFLRALEYYDGILFLTTNRVGAFDDAFISRIHVQLFYKDFTDEERQQVWMTFVQKLNKERGKFIRITMNAKEYIKGTEIRAVKWNGREIRNAFQTAVSLAEYEDEKDEEGKIMLTDEHLRAVVALSKDFKGYLKDLHKADEDKRALRRYERLDV